VHGQPKSCRLPDCPSCVQAVGKGSLPAFFRFQVRFFCGVAAHRS
jgi:hypothetical protein